MNDTNKVGKVALSTTAVLPLSPCSTPPSTTLIMAVHSIHIFDRKGKTLFTKRYAKSQGPVEDAEQLSEQRKLVFGMLFSLRELMGSISPESVGKSAGK